MKLVTLDLLLSLRIFFASEHDRELRKQLTQIAEHPQSLHNAILPRWRDEVETALFQYARRHQSTKPEEVIEPLIAQIEQLPLTNDSYQYCLMTIQNALQMETESLPQQVTRTWRQQLMTLMLPVITQYKSEPDDNLDTVV